MIITTMHIKYITTVRHATNTHGRRPHSVGLRGQHAQLLGVVRQAAELEAVAKLRAVGDVREALADCARSILDAVKATLEDELGTVLQVNQLGSESWLMSADKFFHVLHAELQDDQGHALAQFVRAGRRPRRPHAAELVEHPVPRRIEPLQVPLRAARHGCLSLEGGRGRGQRRRVQEVG